MTGVHNSLSKIFSVETLEASVVSSAKTGNEKNLTEVYHCGQTVSSSHNLVTMHLVYVSARKFPVAAFYKLQRHH
jgi:hypothetical protein